jgi:hypothetical protein
MCAWTKALLSLASGAVLCLPAAAQDWHRGERSREWRRPPHERMGQPRRIDDGRHVWLYPNNNGRFVDQGNGQWVETNDTGSWTFQEVSRTPDCITLYDPSRQAYAALYDNAMYSRTPQTDWGLSYQGSWQR